MQGHTAKKLRHLYKRLLFGVFGAFSFKFPTIGKNSPQLKKFKRDNKTQIL
jgi:hypothetical protein